MLANSNVQYNVGSDERDLFLRWRRNAALNELIRTAAPDIVALQGCWFGARVALPEGWHVCQEGEILVASR